MSHPRPLHRRSPTGRLTLANSFLRAGFTGIALVAAATLGLTLVGALVALVVASLL